MAETLANGTVVPQGSDPIHASGVQAMRNLGGSVDAQLGARYTKAQADALLDGKAPVSHTHSWAQVTGKPTTFTPSAHSHVVADVDGLADALDQAGAGVSVIAFGATGDGATDDTAAFTAALASGGPVYVPGGTYRVSGAYASGPVDLTMANDAVIQHDATGPGILIEGTETPAQTEAGIALSGDVQTGATSFVALGHGLAPGDYFRLGSELPWDASSTNIRQGEILRVATVSGSEFTSTTPAMGGPYLQADTAAIWRLGLIEGVTIRGGTIRGPRTPNLVQTGLLIRRARNVTVEGVRFEDIDYRHAAYEDVLDWRHDRNTHDWAQDAGMAYGVAATNASQDFQVTRCTFVDVRHAFTTSNLTAVRGIVRRGYIGHNVLRRSLPALNEASSGGDGFDTHTAADDITFEHNIIEASSGQGINIECRRSKVRWNTVIAPVGAAISVHNEGDLDGSTEVVGNTVIAGPDTTYGIRIMPSTRGAGTTLHGVTVSENTVEGVSTTPIYIGSPNGPTLYGVSAHNNMGRENTGSYLVRIYNCAGVSQSGNNAATGTKGVLAEDVAPLADDPGFDIVNLTDGEAPVGGTVRYLRIGAPTGAQQLRRLTGGGRGQVITVRNSLAATRLEVLTSSNIELAAPLTLNGTHDTVTLAYTGSRWAEVSRRLTAENMVPHEHGVDDIAGLTARLAELEQDTGDRNITSLVPGAGAGHWTVRRTGRWVYTNLYDLDLTATAGDYWQKSGFLPIGFRPPAASQYVHFDCAQRTTGFTPGPFRVDRYGGVTVYGVTGKLVAVTASWPTNDPFPTTLPGTPA